MMARRVPLRAARPLARTAGLRRTAGLSGAPWDRTATRPIRPVSLKRQRENRERAAMADRRWPGRREGTVLCANPRCGNRAQDLHEIVRRSQLGSITSEENTIPLCRPCNQALADGPPWGYRLGLIRHDALCCRGRDVCSRYAEGGEAA